MHAFQRINIETPLLQNSSASRRIANLCGHLQPTQQRENTTSLAVTLYRPPLERLPKKPKKHKVSALNHQATRLRNWSNYSQGNTQNHPVKIRKGPSFPRSPSKEVVLYRPLPNEAQSFHTGDMTYIPPKEITEKEVIKWRKRKAQRQAYDLFVAAYKVFPSFSYIANQNLIHSYDTILSSLQPSQNRPEDLKRTSLSSLAYDIIFSGMVGMAQAAFLTPFTIVADIISGMMLPILLFNKEKKTQELAVLALKRIVVLPIEQLAFIGIMTAPYIVAYKVNKYLLPVALLLWLVAYRIGAFLVNRLGRYTPERDSCLTPPSQKFYESSYVAKAVLFEHITPSEKQCIKLIHSLPQVEVVGSNELTRIYGILKNAKISPDRQSFQEVYLQINQIIKQVFSIFNLHTIPRADFNSQSKATLLLVHPDKNSDDLKPLATKIFQIVEQLQKVTQDRLYERDQILLQTN